MNRLKTLLTLLLTLSLMVSCSNDEGTDLEPPRIDVNSPEEGEEFAAGGPVPFEALFSDNKALGTYSIDIHNAFDGHSHGRKSEDPDLLKFSYKQNFDLPAESAHLVALPEEILITEQTMAGPYHFIVQAIDAEGNATSYQDGSIVEIVIRITNESMATISITNLVNGELEIEAGLPLTLEGTITDPPDPDFHGFEEVVVILEEPHEGGHVHGRKAESLYEINLEGAGLDPFYNQDGSLNMAGMVDFTLSEETLAALIAENTDHLDLIVEVHDLQGNISMEVVPVHIHMD